MDTWIEIQPGGFLKKYGSHKFLVKSPAEALRAMFMQVKGFKDAFLKAGDRGVRFSVVTDKREVEDLSHLHIGKPKVVKIIPRYQGSKRGGLGQIAAAIVIAVVAYYTGGAGAAGGAAAAGTWGAAATSVAYSVAISLALGGITQMLTPTTSGLSDSSDSDNSASYAFGGPVNTTAQGQPVPLFYGYREVGGAIVSASIVSEDQQ